MDPSDMKGQLKRSAVPTDQGTRPSSGQQSRASIPQGIPANARHEYHGRAVAANARLGHAVATDPPVTDMDDQLQSPAATADQGGQPSSAQREGANMQQDMAPAGIYANAGHEHHGPAVAGQPTSHVYPAMAGMGTPLQQHFNTFVPPTSYGYGSLPPVGGNAMPPLSHSASPQYAGHMNLQQPRVPANLDPQQQHEIMHYLQLMQHQQMHRNVTLPSTPQTMGPSSGTPRPEDITT
ncbi:MAG: hypothetical protein CMQ16_04300, partial [Gammaproteobacteria bacterium]|nr:hypothetical protein [Gammaproteobacteria bacterium]